MDRVVHQCWRLRSSGGALPKPDSDGLDRTTLGTLNIPLNIDFYLVLVHNMHIEACQDNCLSHSADQTLRESDKESREQRLL